MNLKKAGFSTRAIHTGEKATETGAIITPIYQSASFEFKNMEHAAKVMSRQVKGYVYTRSLNPTGEVLEEKMASLEGSEAALVQASGMAAISAAVFTAVKAGCHMIADEVIYGSTYDLFVSLRRFGVEVTFTDTSDIRNVENSFQDSTKLVFFETPANPTLKLTDIRAVSEMAHEKGAVVIVDNTFMTPYFQQPLKQGADVVVHSATKYLNGHGDTLGGIVAGKADFISAARRTSKNIGGVIAPFSAWLILRGLKTLAVRMEKHNENAAAVAEFLQGHKKVGKVVYPGLKSHPQYGLAQRQMRGSGGMIAFTLKEAEDVPVFLDALRLCKLAVSLGETETLIQHPSTMTHAVVPREERIRYSIVDELVRISVGIEDAEDIISDIEHALS